MQTLNKSGVTKWIAGLSYAIYLMHLPAVWTGARMPPRVDTDREELWRFAVSGVQMYAVAVAVAMPCAWMEMRVHKIRKRLMGRTRSGEEKEEERGGRKGAWRKSGIRKSVMGRRKF